MSKSKSLKPMVVSNLEYLNGRGKIWLNPRYQRDSVWTKSQKQLLIDSILREIDIPKIYFREISDVAGHDYEVVDGQQRLRAIFDFLADNFKMTADSDAVDDDPIAGLQFSNLSMDLQLKLRNSQLDVVIYNSAYSETDIEETFLRMQNGTPLNAPEKRRAIAGNMRQIVEEISSHRIFQLCSFSDTRYAYEDAVSKVLHQLLAGNITDLRPTSINRTYRSFAAITSDQREVKRLKQAFNFVADAFRDTHSPGLKKYSIITLSYLVAEMLDTYDLSKHATEFAECYLNFDSRRIANEELPEEEQDSVLSAYTDAARSDSIQDMRYRYEVLRDEIVACIPTLVLKDPNRSFTQEQRMAIYRKDGGHCQAEGCVIVCDESDFHADHVVADSRGGPTSVANGQVLCPTHNLQKGDRE